jgi:ubiquinone/menaquinone biosynthesis C-methylase UbiE
VRRPEFIARQAACPSGLLGRLIAHLMARETAPVNTAALELLELQTTDHVLEVGFGHGATIARVAAVVSGGFVAGVDPSAEMCRVAARRNHGALAKGRVALHQASADKVPYPDQRFDKILSVHTVYFWSDMGAALREISRVLKRGGRLVLAHRTDPGARADFPASVYRFPEADELEESLSGAGFDGCRTVTVGFGEMTVSFHVSGR